MTTTMTMTEYLRQRCNSYPSIFSSLIMASLVGRIGWDDDNDDNDGVSKAAPLSFSIISS